jgi:hypothetical protein
MVPGMPWTAARYFGVMQVAAAPKPSACVLGAGGRCQCYTVQATRLDVPDLLCRQIVDRGWFDETQEGGDKRGDGRIEGREGKTSFLEAKNESLPVQVQTPTR